MIDAFCGILGGALKPTTEANPKANGIPIPANPNQARSRRRLRQKPLDLIPQFLAPSQSLDWQCAARPTGVAFVTTSGSFGVCVSTSIINQIPVALVYRM